MSISLWVQIVNWIKDLIPSHSLAPESFSPHVNIKSDDSCKKVAVDLSGYINKPKYIKYIPGGHIYSNSVRVQIIAFKNRKQFFFQIGQRE